MRRLFSFFLCMTASVGILSLCVSCTEDKPEPDNHETDKPKEEEFKLEPGMYSFTVSPMKKKWEAGDKIYVHGAYGPAAQLITLSASDISEDGRTATARLDGVTEYPLKPDGLYAAWPGDAIMESDNLQDTSLEFSKTDTNLAVAYLDDHNFAFADAASGITFKAEGFTNFALAGASRPGLRVTIYQAQYEKDFFDFSNRKSDGYPFLYGTITDGVATLWYPGNITIKKGLNIYLGKDGKWPYIYSVTEDVKLKVGEIKDLGDISGALTAYTGLDPKMPEMGKMTKYSVEIGELSGLCLSADKSFIWAVGDPGLLGRIDFEGHISDVHSIGGDAEGVTIDPATGDLLIALEPCGVGRIKASNNYAGKVETIFKIKDASKYGNSGMEGITYYKDGKIYCGTQTGSDLFLCDLSAEVDGSLYLANVTKSRLVEKFPQISEIGGLCYDPLTDWLWITDSESRRIFALTGDGQQILGSYSVSKVGNAESICVDHEHSCIWIGHDPDTSPSSLYRFDFTGLDDAIIHND